MYKKINLLSIISLITLLLSCSDNQYCYKSSINDNSKVFCFKENFRIKKIELDSLIDLCLLNSMSKLKNTSTFEVDSLWISNVDKKDTSILTINGKKDIKNSSILKINVLYTGKNAYGVPSSFSDYYSYLIEDNKLLTDQPIHLTFKIEETINENPEYYIDATGNTQYLKHTIDSLYIISWNEKDATIVNNMAKYYGNHKRNFNISKNNVLKAIDILKNKDVQFKIEKDLLEDGSFGLICGIYDRQGKFSYKDDYLHLDTKDKKELIERLIFISKFIYDTNHEPKEWKVIKKNGKNQEEYIK